MGEEGAGGGRGWRVGGPGGKGWEKENLGARICCNKSELLQTTIAIHVCSLHIDI